MTDDELRDWFADFHPRVRAGFKVEDPDGTLRTITNVEMDRYVHASHILRDDIKTAAKISQFLFGAENP